MALQYMILFLYEKEIWRYRHKPERSRIRSFRMLLIMHCPQLNVKCFLGFPHFLQNHYFSPFYFVYKDGLRKIPGKKCLQAMESHGPLPVPVFYSVLAGETSCLVL